MSLTEPTYFAFLAIATSLLNWKRTQNYRLELLVAFSLMFYATFSVANVAILCSVIVIAYFGAIGLERMDGKRGQNLALFLLVFFVGSPLLLFKYAKDIQFLGQLIPPGLTFPIGVSFYTFLAIGYLVDVNLGLQPAVKNITKFFAFLTFFPSITSGPIERSRHFLPQLNKLGTYNYENVVAGLRAILLGLVLKLVISEAIRPIVDQVYSAPELYGRADIIIATTFFAFQVYADFAGYSLIAIGSAKLLGIDLLKNFTQPFLSSTIPEFWRSWHISLSSWVKDYVFGALQIQLRSMKMLGFAIAALTSFIAVGLWHGAGMQFLVFGIIHGVLVIGSTMTLARRDAFWQRVGIPFNILTFARVLFTFCLVTATLVLFRGSSWESALGIYQRIVFHAPSPITLNYQSALLATVFLIVGDIYTKNGRNWTSMPRPVRLAIYHCMVIAIAVSYFASKIFQDAPNSQFIYYKF